MTERKKISSLRPYLTALLSLSVIACSSEPAADAADRISQWALPDRLREISGLALSADERLFAVTDEVGVVYEIDYANGRLVKAFALGDPVLEGDFEGIAVVGDVFWLMTSDGDLFSAAEGADGEKVPYTHFNTKIHDECEFEGLAEFEGGESLALLCKNAARRKDLRLFEWHLADERILKSGGFELPEKKIENALDEKRFNPSAITVRPATGNWLVLSARQYAIIELGVDGEFIDVIMTLDKERHFQAEGLAITKDGRLLIADEGGRGKARLAIYPLDTGKNNN